jgi:predicted nucleic-acid-binding Zn-ribbon protein
MGFFKSFNDALNGSDDNTFVIAGRQLLCSHCGNNTFQQGNAQLNTAGLTFLNLDWANRSAITFICENCGHIEWFLEPAE